MQARRSAEDDERRNEGGRNPRGLHNSAVYLPEVHHKRDPNGVVRCGRGLVGAMIAEQPYLNVEWLS